MVFALSDPESKPDVATLLNGFERRFSEEDDPGLRKNTRLPSWEDFPKNRGNRETCETR
jgi:hypothetical protein